MDQGDKQFISEQVMKILDDSVNGLFMIKQQTSDRDIIAPYVKEKADANINNLLDLVIRGIAIFKPIKGLCKLNKPFKYNVTGVFMQNIGAGLHTCSLAYSDPSSDGAVTVQRQVGDHIIVLTIFAMQI